MSGGLTVETAGYSHLMTLFSQKKKTFCDLENGFVKR